MVQSYKTPLSKSSPAEQIKASISHFNGLCEAGSPGLGQAYPQLSPRRKPPPTLLSVSRPDIRPRAVSAHSIGASFVTNNSKANTGRRKGSDQWQTLVGIPQICPVDHSCSDSPLRPPSPASSASSYQTALTTIQDSTPYLDARELPLSEDILTLEPPIAQFTWNESALTRPSNPSSRSRSRSPHSRAPLLITTESMPKDPRLQSKPSQILLDYRVTPTPPSNDAPPFPCPEETQTTLRAWQNEREMEDRVSFARKHHPTAVEDLYIFGSPQSKTAIEESFQVFPKLGSVFCHSTPVDESIIRTFQRRHWELISLEGCTTHFDAQLINGRITTKSLAFTQKWAETDNPKPWLSVVNWQDVRILRLESLHVCRVFLSNLSFGKRLTFVRQLTISFPPGMYIEWCGLMSSLTRVQDLCILSNAANDLPIIPASFLPVLQSFNGPISAVKHYATKHLKRLDLYGNKADGGCDVAEIRDAIRSSAEEWSDLEHLELRVHHLTEELYQDIGSTFKHLKTLVITVTDGPHPQILDANQVLPSIEALRVGASLRHVELHHRVWLQAEKEEFHIACASAIDRMQDLGQLATAVFTSRSLFSLLNQTPEVAAVLEPQNLRWTASGEEILTLSETHNTKFATTAKLSPEVLSQIFDCLAPWVPQSLHSDPLRTHYTWIKEATHICRSWRSIVLSSPRLWSVVFLHPKEWAELVLQRAKSVPLDLEFPVLSMAPKMTEADTDLIRLAFARPEHSIRSVDITFINDKVDSVLQLISSIVLDDPVHRLERLYLSSRSMQCVIPDGLFSQSRLRHLTLKNCAVTLNTPRFSRLRSLYLIHDLHSAAWPDLLDALATMSELETLSLEDHKDIYGDHGFNHELLVQMPNLQEITLIAKFPQLLNILKILVAPRARSVVAKLGRLRLNDVDAIMSAYSFLQVQLSAPSAPPQGLVISEYDGEISMRRQGQRQDIIYIRDQSQIGRSLGMSSKAQSPIT